MTSIADAFPTQSAADSQPADRRRPSPRLRVVGDGPQAGPAVAQEPTVARRGQAVAGRATGVVRTVWADLVGAWPWHGTPPTLADLAAARIPDIDTVPGHNRALWIAWAVYNHLTIAVYAITYPALWWMAHPARALLTAAVAAPLIYVWS